MLAVRRASCFRACDLCASFFDAARTRPIGFALGDALHRAGSGKGDPAFTITVSGGFILFLDLPLALAAVELCGCVGSMRWLGRAKVHPRREEPRLVRYGGRGDGVWLP